MPSFWQVVGGSAAHSLSGSVPLAIGRQRPFAWPVLGNEQAAHRAPHDDSQQTLSTQLPDVHWLEVVHGEPSGSVVPQVVPTQEYPVAQSELIMQVVLQAVGLQAYGSQGTVVTDWQVPAPLQ